VSMKKSGVSSHTNGCIGRGNACESGPFERYSLTKERSGGVSVSGYDRSGHRTTIG